MRLLNNTIYHFAMGLRRLGFEFHEMENPKVRTMQSTIAELGKIEFRIEQYPDGSWTAESVNVDGIISGGTSGHQISPMIRDAIFTYFGIPPYLCNDMLLKSDNEPITVTQRIYV